MVQLLALESTRGGVELEWPKEVGDCLEFRADGIDLVNNVFDALNANGAEGSTNDRVGTERNSLSRKLSVT